MAAQVHRLSHAGKQQSRRPRAQVPLLRAVGALWAATDLRTVVAAARALLRLLVPDATIACCARSDARDRAAALDPHTVSIDLQQSELRITGNPRDPAGRTLLKVAAELIETRVGTLARTQAAESLRLAHLDLEHRVDERTRDLRLEIAERKRVEAQLKYETLHDALTGLPNRGLLMQRLEEALTQYQAERSPGFAVLFLDLDRFKIINDSVGHMIGDTLLMRAGERIRACVKATDVVARLGGDEFAVLLEGIADEARASGIADRIIHDMNEPFRLPSGDLFTSVSIGIALAAPRYGKPEELLRDADSAMNCAKAGGRHRYAVFDDALRREAMARLRVENGLRSGLVRREFVPYYQPIVDLEDGSVMGYEALMRWRHPQRGILLPGEFLDVAEDTGTSEAMDWQIFTQVCRDANALLGNGDGFVAINLSARHFRNPQLDQRLLGLLDEYGVPPAHLHVEVTEHALVENTPTVKRILTALREAGINISLDDFGTGYSSLAYLHQYPLQTIKIDRSFVTNLGADADAGSDAVIRAILAMAQTLSIQVIAEGVETPGQRDRLRDLGCRLAQGFLYAKARPIDAWLRNGTADGPDATMLPGAAVALLHSDAPPRAAGQALVAAGTG